MGVNMLTPDYRKPHHTIVFVKPYMVYYWICLVYFSVNTLLL